MSIPAPANETTQHHFTFTNPNYDALGRHIVLNAKRNLPMLERDCHGDAVGALVCAPGPTLLKRENLRELRRRARRGWWVIAIKEAINLLRERNVAVHYSVAMDPDANQVDKTPLVREIVYLVASSCHPALFQHLAGHEVRVYHSCCGWQGAVKLPDGTDQAITELHLYKLLYGTADTVVGGYTVVNRAVSVAKYMGFPKVAVFGAPFGWRRDDAFYAKGVHGQAGNVGKDLCDHGFIDGRPWYSRPDMIASALHLAVHVRSGAVEVVGDSMAASLARLELDKLKRVFPQIGEPAPQQEAA